MQTVIRWTEDELVREIQGLDSKLKSHSEASNGRSAWARSYLRALLKDREETLRLLRFRRAQAERERQPISSLAARAPGVTRH
jgi:hypothetical protein